MEVEIFSSWLKKKNAKGSILSRGWTKRWFGLSYQSFYYYKSSRERSPSGEFPMHSFKRIRRRSDVEFEVSFVSRTFFLRAESSVDVDRWFQAFSTISEEEAHARRAGNAFTSDHRAAFDEEDDEEGDMHYVDGCRSPARQVLARIPKHERRQSSPTSPLQIGSGSSEASADSRPESAVTSLEMPTKSDEQHGRGRMNLSSNVLDTSASSVRDSEDGEENAKVSPRALLADPSKAFGTFFAGASNDRCGDNRTDVLQHSPSSYSEETSVMAFGDDKNDDCLPSPRPRANSGLMMMKSRVRDDNVVADENWIEEDFDDDDDIDETPSGLARHMSWNTRAASTMQDHQGRTGTKTARRSLELDGVQPYDSMYSQHGGVVPDKNWIDDDWDSDE